MSIFDIKITLYYTTKYLCKSSKEKKGDRRVLLALPIEERNLLEPLLKQQDES